ncbi:DUF4145 domain-containing protein [Rhodococcus sp. IEGM 1330]|uniref:DUF4145 domain-containing protein n=1 Tax=Rhodococcus sp. IEGM 1330 TaxID=3082225 RepID=UPI002952D002|nr:DUF4145 domain-containing protein [Rhodococcus sp. IEGM 1330]MDV8021371.1 DUF4145 domain-containing protein [Rhodococcus sp. IEGM 1330]
MPASYDGQSSTKGNVSVKRFVSQLLPNGWFNASSWPSIECPVCNQGVLTVPRAEKNGRIYDDVRYDHPFSQAQYQQINPADVTGIFSVALECNQGDCLGVVHAVGDMAVDVQFGVDDDGHYRGSEVDVLKVKHFYPPVEVFDHHTEYPVSVDQELRRVNALMWLDPAAAMTALRKGVEELLTERGLPTHRNTGKRGRLSLDERLSEFKRDQPELSELLLATKWMGNVATHEDQVTLTEVAEAIEHVELTLTTLYRPNYATALARARSINDAKGRSQP